MLYVACGNTPEGLAERCGTAATPTCLADGSLSSRSLSAALTGFRWGCLCHEAGEFFKNGACQKCQTCQIGSEQAKACVAEADTLCRPSRFGLMLPQLARPDPTKFILTVLIAIIAVVYLFLDVIVFQASKPRIRGPGAGVCRLGEHGFCLHRQILICCSEGGSNH